MYAVTATIDAPVQPTEVPERVADAVRELFPNADLTVTDDAVRGTTHDLNRFRERLYEQEILDTARAEFQRNRVDGGFSFDLKKQAAFQGVVNFSVGSPAELGDIHVEVEVDEPSVDEFVAHLAPETREGKPIED
ncbi:RNA-binding domain-containing protein [Salarchaeum sp. III]|uniref:RNA-binding domain-containing protein n=1 Tax=Salarchaeum sp. III TaxID=3107927 RepID=UPI002ED9D1A6